MGKIRESPLDSTRFGMRIYRAELACDQIAHLRVALDDIDSELLILRVPAGQAAVVQSVLEASHYVRYAEALVYYRAFLESGPHCISTGRALDFELLIATESMAAEIEKLSTKIFTNYRSHYSIEPRFPPQSIAAGYGEWAARLLRSDDVKTLVAVRAGSLVGFLAWKFSQDDQSAEVLLNGVEPSSAGLGIYTAMLGAALARMRTEGISFVEISTQLHNIKVQRVWCKHGLVIDRALDTLHVLPVT